MSDQRCERSWPALATALEAGLDLPATLAAACRRGGRARWAPSGRPPTPSPRTPRCSCASHGDGPDVLPPGTGVRADRGRRPHACCRWSAPGGRWAASWSRPRPAPDQLSWARVVAAHRGAGGRGGAAVGERGGRQRHARRRSPACPAIAASRACSPASWPAPAAPARTSPSACSTWTASAAYNERTSRADGDRILRLAAECFSRGVRSYDCVCRLGGDAFALVLPGMGAEPTATLVSRLAATFASWLPEPQRMTVSGGVAAFPQHAGGQAELVALATAALERAQQAGGGRISIYVPRQGRRAELALGRPRAQAARADGRHSGPGPRRQHLRRPAGRRAGPRRRAGRAAAGGRLPLRHAGADDGPAERARLAARVAAGALDAEAAEWILARERPPAERPLETRILAVAEAFVLADGHAAGAGAGPRPGRAVEPGRRRRARPRVRAGARAPARLEGVEAPAALAALRLAAGLDRGHRPLGRHVAGRRRRPAPGRRGPVGPAPACGAGTG